MAKIINTNQKVDYKMYSENFDVIAWEYVTCSECGQVYKNKDKEKKMIWTGTDWVCKRCNFN